MLENAQQARGVWMIAIKEELLPKVKAIRDATEKFEKTKLQKTSQHTFRMQGSTENDKRKSKRHQCLCCKHMSKEVSKNPNSGE